MSIFADITVRTMVWYTRASMAASLPIFACFLNCCRDLFFLVMFDYSSYFKYIKLYIIFFNNKINNKTFFNKMNG
jgi:hypothetical protein